VDFEAVKNLIKQTLTDAEVEIIDLTGTRDHLGITVTSDAFKGKRLLQQHQMVMDILKEQFKRDLHAVKIKTLTFDQTQG
jgi:stress-induced morphogen